MREVIRIRRPNGPVLRQNKWEDVEYLTFPKLEETGIVEHLFTTRLGGVSEGMYASMSLKFDIGDDPERVLENYRRIGEILHCDRDHMVASHQTHTTNIRVVTEADAGKGVVRPRDYSDIDGLVTDCPGLALVTFYADCVPLYFVDPVKRVIGLAHSGWRGTVERMGACMVRKLQEEYACEPKNILVAIGPAICQECYEVSEEVACRFADLESRMKEEKRTLLKSGIYDNFSNGKVCVPGEKPGKYQLDLWLANALILCEAGICASRISIADICTCHNPDYLFSHRASMGKRGNLAAFLMLKEECGRI